MKEQCKNCGKELRDEASLKRGFGPECWNKQKAKGTLPILVTFSTGRSDADMDLFDPQEAGAEHDLVIAVDASQILGDYNSYCDYGIQITNEIRNTGLFPWIDEKIQEAWQHGNLEVSMYARKHLIPAKTMPEMPPNMMHKKQIESLNEFDDEWVPLIHWNTQRIELISLKPKKWELKENKIALVLSNEFNTGTLFAEDDEGGFAELSEKYAGLYGDKDWIPTMEFENWMDGPKNRFWVENPHIKFFKNIIENKNIVLASPVDLLEVIGTKWHTSDESYRHMELQQQAYAHSYMIMELEESMIMELDWPMLQLKDTSGWNSPFRWSSCLSDNEGKAISDLDEEDLETFRKAVLLPYADEIYCIWKDLLEDLITEEVHVSPETGMQAVSIYKQKTEDSQLMQAVKIALWDEFRNELCQQAERMWYSNTELEIDCEWEYDPCSSHSFYMFGGDPGEGNDHDKSLEKIRRTITHAVEDGLKKLVLSVLNTDNEIFAKADYD